MLRSEKACRVGIVVITLCCSFTSTVRAGEPILIGGSLALSGSYAPGGQTQLRGFQLCIKQANAKGGALGRRIKLVVEDDRSKGANAAHIYRKLILEDKVDAVLGPYSSTVTEAMADITEKYHKPMIASGSASNALFRKGRKFIFMVLSPAEVYFEGLVDLAVRHGLKTIAFIYQDALFTRSTVLGGQELARKNGLEVVLVEAYPRGTTDFGPTLRKVRETNPDALAAATYFDDALRITRQMKASNINVKMFGATVGVHTPKFYQTLGTAAEFVYGATQWEPQLVNMRAGGLIPIEREYPGARDFVAAYKKEFPGKPFSHLTTAAYSACRLLVDAIKRAGSLEGDRIRKVVLAMDTNTPYGTFRVDGTGLQIGHKMMWFQWQDGKKVIVWPREITPRKPRFPTPQWTRR